MSVAHFIAAYREQLGAVDVRDPEYPCAEYDAKHYDGRGSCMSDGHYMCTECSELSPDAPRFTRDRDGRRDRLRLFFLHLGRERGLLPR